MSERPETVACDCGAAMAYVIRPTPNVFVKGADFEFKREHVVGNNGVLAGRSAEQQHRSYQQVIDGLKRQHDRRKRGCSKQGSSVDGVRIEGIMPGEMVDSIGWQEGDKEAVSKDSEFYMRKTGTWIGD